MLLSGESHVARFTVIEDASETLLAILSSAVQRTFPAGADRPTVQLAQPVDFEALPPTPPTPPEITVWLYRVVPDASKRNGPRRILPDGSVGRPLLPLALHYLMTPWSGDVNTTHALAGLIAQAMYDRCEVGSTDLIGRSGRPPAWDDGDSIQVQMEDLSTEELHRVWDSAEMPYRLSLAYRVQVVGIEPTESTPAGRVVEAVFIGGGEPS
jgi:hypothetical protein